MFCLRSVERGPVGGRGQRGGMNVDCLSPSIEMTFLAHFTGAPDGINFG
jgi:hypothetical protein